MSVDTSSFLNRQVVENSTEIGPDSRQQPRAFMVFGHGPKSSFSASGNDIAGATSKSFVAPIDTPVFKL